MRVASSLLTEDALQSSGQGSFQLPLGTCGFLVVYGLQYLAGSQVESVGGSCTTLAAGLHWQPKALV